MARREERQLVTQLRIAGRTYSEIRREMNIPKSTLSDWLSGYPLSTEQIERIKEKVPARIEKFRLTMENRRLQRRQKVYLAEKNYWIPLSERELLLAGLFLYWGEGTKVSSSTVSISNSDPKVIQFAYYWMTHSLGVESSKIGVLLHLYNDMDVQSEVNFWKDLLHLSQENFRKPFIKSSKRSGLTHKSFGHGTCNLILSNVPLKDKIMESIAVVSDYYNITDKIH